MKFSRTSINTLFARHVVVSIAAFCTACTFLPQPTQNVTRLLPPYDPAVSARIRIHAANGIRTARFYPGKSCTGGVSGDSDNVVRVDGGFWAGYKYSADSITIGMPASPRQWMRVEGLQFKDYIKEYVVGASEPLTIMMRDTSRAGSYTSFCTPPAITFTPTAGEDYDVFMEFDKKQCWISVRRIDGHGADVPVEVNKAGKCE